MLKNSTKPGTILLPFVGIPLLIKYRLESMASSETSAAPDGRPTKSIIVRIYRDGMSEGMLLVLC